MNIKDPIFKVETKKDEKGYGKIEISPLPHGYGQTLGNSLRRVLLSSLPGAAVTSVRIKGVRHQYSTIEGLKEDVLGLILNLKKIRLKIHDVDSAKMSLKVDKKGKITAGDIEVPSEVEIVNEDLYLGSFMGGKKSLEMEIEVENGYGYQLGSERKIDTVGVIPIDGLFSPVTRVNYKVEATRVGRQTNLDKLVMEIWTDETIGVSGAVKEAAEILIGYFQQVYDPKEVVEKKDEDEDEVDSDILELSVEDLDLPMRIANSLSKGGLKKVGDLSQVSKEELAKIKNIGGKSLDTIIERLKDKGVSLKEDET